MRLIASCAIVTLCCGTMLGSNTSHIKEGIVGTVADEVESVPIGNALIVVYSEEGHVVSVSHADARGNFEVELTPGMYDVMAVSGPFVPTCAKLKVSSGAISKFEPRLRADIAHMEH